MRHLAFALLCTSALALGCTPPTPAPVTPTKPAGGPAPTSGTTAAMDAPAGVKMVSMMVDMHCPYGCYPTVEKTLTAMTGVSSVKLAEQKNKDTIDNPKVYVSVDSRFDSKAAVAALEKAGFASEMLQ